MDFLCEHAVERKKVGLYRFKKAAIISLWVLIPAVVIMICFAISSINTSLIALRYSIFLVPLVAFFALKLGPMTAAYGEMTYEYSIASGEMSFAKIYGDRFRKEWFKLTLSKLERCAPYDQAFGNEADNGSFDHIYKAVSSFDAPHIYYAIFKNDRDERCIVFFEVIKKSLKMIKTYYPQTVMTNLPY